jgi:hypothetical protein
MYENENDLIVDSNSKNNQILNLLSPKDVPYISPVLTREELIALILENFSDIIATVTFEPEKVILHFKNPENQFIREVGIPMALWNTEKAHTSVCNFIFEESTIRKGVDYFKNEQDNKLVLNVNQVLYMILHHRCTQFRNFKQHYVDLLADDISNLSSFIDYVIPNTYNGKLKVKYLYAIINYLPMYNAGLCAGEYIASSSLNEASWSKVMRDLRINISSESSMSKKNKLVILPQGVVYKSVGFHDSNDVLRHDIYTIFEGKQNLASRLKSHVLTDAYPLEFPAVPVFMQNLKRDAEGVIVPLDKCLKEVVVVFHAMDPDTQRFVAGEIEASVRVAKTLVHIVQTVDVAHFEPEQKLEIGTKIEFKSSDKKGFVIGLDEEHEPVVLKGLRNFKVLDITHHGAAGCISIRLDAVMYAGNARIISDSGIKGVTKIKPNLGHLVYEETVYEEVKLDMAKFTPSVRRALKKERKQNIIAENVMKEPVLKRSQPIEVDLIMGMNAVKGHSNTIVLAQAAFAVKYGHYIPSVKNDLHGILDSLDEVEINAAAAALPKYKFINEDGVEAACFYGLAYVQFTELGAMYTTFKKQSFMFESGKNIRYNDTELADYIWDRYLDVDALSAVKELTKILGDTRAYLAEEDGLPVYSSDKIRKNKIFDYEKDLVMTKKSMFESQSKLLDENWNKGFYIDLSRYSIPVIRVPSAKFFRLFMGKMKDGYTTYHYTLINISKLISYIIGKPSDGNNMSIPFIYDKTGKRNTAYSHYMNSIKGTLYSSEDSSQMMIQALIKPQVHGINMKQVVEYRLPPNTIVIMNDKLHSRLYKLASSKLNEDGTITVSDNLFAGQDDSAYDSLDSYYNECPLAMTIRHPS